WNHDLRSVAVKVVDVLAAVRRLPVQFERLLKSHPRPPQILEVPRPSFGVGFPDDTGKLHRHPLGFFPSQWTTAALGSGSNPHELRGLGDVANQPDRLSELQSGEQVIPICL